MIMMISTWDHCQRSLPSRISDTPQAGFEPAQNLSSGLVEWSCAVVIIKTVSLSSYLVPRLIKICRIQWWCSVLLISSGNTLFWVNLVQKLKVVSLSWNLVSTLISICRTQCWCSVFLFSTTRNTFLGEIWSKNSKLSV